MKGNTLSICDVQIDETIISTTNEDMKGRGITVETLESNSPEISEEDIQEIARSLVSSFSSFITIECRNVGTSTVSIDTKNAQTETHNITSIMKNVSTSHRVEVQDAETETEWKQCDIETFISPKEMTSALISISSDQNENQENVPPGNNLSGLIRVSEDDIPFGQKINSDRTLPSTMEELDLDRKAKKHAYSDHIVPQGNKYMKIEPIFRNRIIKTNLSVNTDSSFSSTKPLNIRLYDLEYMTDPPIIEHEIDTESTAIVPEANTAPPCPYLRLGLSRRTRPRKPLHENFINDSNTDYL